MKAKLLLAVVAVLFAATFVSCNADDDDGDKTSTVRMYVSAETGLRLPFGATGYVECMKVKEEGWSDYQPLDMQAIGGFSYVKGCAYTLLVKKTTLANPPADGSLVIYELMEILETTDTNLNGD